MPVAVANESGQTWRRGETSTGVGGRLGKYMRANVDITQTSGRPEGDGWRWGGRRRSAGYLAKTTF